jgi:hypothetical protein
MKSGWSLLLLRFLRGVLVWCFTVVIRFTLNGVVRNIIGALRLVMYSLRITMLFSSIVASCSDRIPDSELIANDSALGTRLAFLAV